MNALVAVTAVLLFVVLAVLTLAAVWVRVHLPAVVEPGDISHYLHNLWVFRALLRPLWTRGRNAFSGLTNSLPRRRAAFPESERQATAGSAGRRGRRRLPGGAPADPARTSADPARCAVPAQRSGEAPTLPDATCEHSVASGTACASAGAGHQTPASPSGRTATPPRRVVVAHVQAPASGAVALAHGRGGTKAPDSNAVRGSAVVEGTRAPGDGPQAADATGASACATSPDETESDGRGGALSFLAYMFGIERPAWSPPRGRVGVEVVPTATPAVPVEPAERSSMRSAFRCSRRRGGPDALAGVRVPLPRQPADRRVSAAVPSAASARAERLEHSSAGE